MKIAFVGGTGPAGIGLGARLCRAGHDVAIGSRSEERAREAAATVQGLAPEARVRAGRNDDVIPSADVVFLTVRDDAQREAVRSVAGLLEGKILVSMANPLDVSDGRATYQHPPEGSLAEEAQRDAPGARVVSALHEIRVSRFAKVDRAIDSDTVVTGDDDVAKQVVMELCSAAGVRPVDGGPLHNSRYVEAFVAVLVTINFRYRAGVSYRITGLPDGKS
ncbi:MAG: NADPH-dependent F420 reductase [Actinomycetota bacterium]